MKNNVGTYTGMNVLFMGLGTFLGAITIGLIKSLNMDMALSSCFVSSLSPAVGRAACVMLVCIFFNLATQKNK